MTCTVCGAENPATATVCHKCKAYLQNRVPTLDLFRTAWRTITVPSKAFHEIAIAEHKNYAISLFAAAGIPLLNATVAWLKAGDLAGGLFETTGAVVGIGVVAGALLGLALSLFHMLGATILRGDASFRRSMGVSAYALVPTVAVGLALLPVELLTFGEHWFVGNPPAATINGASFWTMIVLHGVSMAWSLVLLVIGAHVALRMPYWRAGITAVISVGAVAGGWMWLAQTAEQLLFKTLNPVLP
jgi:hypothetical protein